MTIYLDILRALEGCRGFLLPEPTLLNDLRLTRMPPPTVTEFREALETLESRRLITSVRSDLGGPIKWRITDAGRGELAANN